MVGAIAVLTACGPSGPPTSGRRLESGLASTTTSEIAPATKMICAAEAQRDLATTLGVTTIKAPTATWTDHRYSCVYTYTQGYLTLSVKQLDGPAATRRYFESLAARMHRRRVLAGIGEASFTAANGSIVVVKDDKVLVVDVQHLPAAFGVPADTRANAAISVAATIMGCWTEQ